ncbi:MAG: hypothetical protein KC443_09020 [Anaerolineales bacterium]|nr:hypothetical protein [Anaerolineales bacterium]
MWPRLRLDFYETAVVMSRWAGDGRVVAYPVSVHDVVGACTDIPLSSGLLPANTLFWGQQGPITTLGIYVPARRWRVNSDIGSGFEIRPYHVPMPPLVFVGRGAAYRIFAVKKRPATSLCAVQALHAEFGKSPRLSGVDARLYHAPCPNVHPTGDICQGNTPFPGCSPQTIQAALTLFMEGSLFNADLSQGKCRSHPDDVRQLWAEWDGRSRFPLSELVPTSTCLQALLS